MNHSKSLVLLCSIYLFTVLLGLNTAAFILPLMYPPAGGEPVVEPLLGDPQSFTSTFTVFFYILAGTMGVLFLIKQNLVILIKAALFFSFFMGTLFTLGAMIGDMALPSTIAFLAYVLWRRRDYVAVTLLLVFTISGIGALLGTSLGLLPALALVIIMSIYDIIAVFVTKHMVTLARGVEGQVPLMFVVPVGKRNMGLGAGDIALPLTFTVSVFASQGIGYALPTAFGGLFGLTLLFHYMLGKKDVTLPALPPIVAGLLVGYGISSFIFPSLNM